MKSLAKNSIYNIIYKCSNLIFPLIIAAYVSRILLAEGVGKVSSAQNIVTYFTVLAALGLPTYGTKVIASFGEDRESRNKAFSELFIINAISTAICTIAYYSMIVCIPYFQQRTDLSAVCGMAIIFNVINVDWFYQGREEYGYIMARNLVIKVISLVCVFLFVKTTDDYVIYAAILTLSKVANNIFNIIHIRKYVSFRVKGLNISQHLKPVFVLLAASLAIEIYTLADTTMLTFIHGDEIVGYYTNARKGIDIIRTMIVAVCAVFLPRLSYYYANNQKDDFEGLVNKGVKILLYLTIPATVGVVMTAEYFVPLLFGNAFMESVTTTQILAFSIITVGLSNFFGYQILVTIGKEKHMLISTIIGAVVNVGLNFALVFSLKHNGVAIASAVTELCVAIYQLIIVRKSVRIKIPIRFAISTLIGTAIMAAAVLALKLLIKNALLCLILAILIGIFVYFVITYIAKNDISIMMIDSIKNKFGKLSKKDK